VLSCLLCSLYYGHLEDNHLQKYLRNEDDESLLIRFLDDSLYMTTSKYLAVSFTKKMHKGFEDYGCKVNITKTLVNFDVLVENIPLIKCKEVSGTVVMPWCGWLIDTNNLEIEGDYERYKGNYIRESMTISKTREPGKILFFIKITEILSAKSISTTF